MSLNKTYHSISKHTAIHLTHKIEYTGYKCPILFVKYSIVFHIGALMLDNNISNNLNKQYLT